MKPLLTFPVMALLVSCAAVGPDYHAPSAVVPKQWRDGVNSAQTPYQTQWWRSFNDPLLTQLITEASAANLDVKQAVLRIRDARAQQTMLIASALPAVNAKSNLSRRGNNLTSFGGTNTGTGGGFGIGNQIINIFQAGFDAQWEIDLFGGVRRGLEALEANLQAAEEDRKAVLVSLHGELARLYVQLRSNQRLLAITKENLASQQETLRLIGIRQQAGLNSMLEVAQQEALVAETQALLPGYETTIIQSVHAISLLLGRPPDDLAPRLESERPLPMAKAMMVYLPSELLRRRPDIRRSERQLAAANAEIGVAVAELYPKFNLAAFLGIQNSRITDFTPVGKSWSAAASISMPIFNWGKLQANIKSKKIQKEQYFLDYQTTVLTALKEVEDALQAYKNENQKQQSLVQTSDANLLSLNLAEERYRSGLTTFMDVLDSQRNVLQAQNNLVISQTQSLQHLIALYKALGGGWENF